MSLLSVTPSGLRSRASEMETLRQQHLDVMKRLRILILGLSESWQGEAQAALEKKFLSNSQTMTDLANTLEDYIALAEKAADRSEELDQKLLQAVRSIQ